jgi:hypothetical protein
MYTILIAHHDVRFAEGLAAELHSNGDYAVITCPGPWPPQRCVRCDKGYCPLTEGAHLMIYDPTLVSLDANGRAHNLAIDSALAHPDVPILLAWSADSPPDVTTLGEIRTKVPHAHVAAHNPMALLRQVHGLLQPAAKRVEVIM